MSNEVKAAIARSRNKSEVWFSELKTFNRGFGRSGP